jgi:O-methyltransferase domain
MTKGSKLLLVEIVLPPGDTPSPGKMLDLQMMVITGGRDRTEAEYRTLLEAADFTLTQVVPTPSERSVIEATPA